jgi:hypothetical protein
MSICNCLINERLVNWCEGIDFTGPRVGLALSVLVIVLAAKVSESTKPKFEEMGESPETFDFDEAEVTHELSPSKIDFTILLSNYNDIKSGRKFRNQWSEIYDFLPNNEKTRIARALSNEVGHIKALLSAIKNIEKYNPTSQAVKLHHLLTLRSLTALAELPREEVDRDDKGKDEGRAKGDFSRLLQDYTRLWNEDQTEGKIEFKTNWERIFNELPEKEQISAQNLEEAEMIEGFLTVLGDGENDSKRFVRDPMQGIELGSKETALMLHDLLVGGALNSCLEDQLNQSVIDSDAESKKDESLDGRAEAQLVPVEFEAE